MMLGPARNKEEMRVGTPSLPSPLEGRDRVWGDWVNKFFSK
jgi:hypothetical protein